MSRAVAVNHAGWNVEYFSDDHGWRPVDEEPYATREQAEARLAGLLGLAQWTEYRVYEALS